MGMVASSVPWITRSGKPCSRSGEASFGIASGNKPAAHADNPGEPCGLGERGVEAHDASLAESHQVHLRGIELILVDQLAGESQQELPAPLRLFGVDLEAARDELDRKPCIRIRTARQRSPSTHHRKSRIELRRQAEQVLLVAADSVQEDKGGRSPSRASVLRLRFSNYVFERQRHSF